MIMRGMMIVFALVTVSLQAQSWKTGLPEYLESQADTSFVLGEQPLAGKNTAVREFEAWEVDLIDVAGEMVKNDYTRDLVFLAPANPTSWVEPFRKIGLYLNMDAANVRGEDYRKFAISRGIPASQVIPIPNPWSKDLRVRVYVIPNERAQAIRDSLESYFKELKGEVKALGFRVDTHDQQIDSLRNEVSSLSGRVDTLEAAPIDHPVGGGITTAAWVGPNGQTTTGMGLFGRYKALKLSYLINPVESSIDSFAVREWMAGLSLDLPIWKVSERFSFGPSFGLVASGRLNSRLNNFEVDLAPTLGVCFQVKTDRRMLEAVSGKVDMTYSKQFNSAYLDDTSRGKPKGLGVLLTFEFHL